MSIGDPWGAAAAVTDTAATDATNIAMQKQAQQFNASQAALNRSFQSAQQIQAEQYNTEMSDTQIQRRAQDLQKANFNPLLAVGQLGGASSPMMSAPSGSTASSPAPPQMRGPVQEYASLELASAQAANTNQNTKLQQSQKEQIDYQNNILAMDASPAILVARQQAMMAKYAMDYAQASEVDAAVQSIRNGVKSQNLDIAFKEFQNQLAGMDVKERQATINTLIEMKNSVNSQQTQEAKNVLWAQSIPVLSKAIATAQAVMTPVSSAAGAAGSAAGAAKSLIGSGGALVP